MRRTALLVCLALAAPATAGEPSDDAAPGEENPCADELETVERRRRSLEEEGLSPDEIARRNGPHLRALADCRERTRPQRSPADEARREEQEIARRAGPNATEKERAAARREVRMERLSAKKASQLTPEERAELDAGMKEEMAATHAALDRAHARDRGFQRIVHSAVVCYHAARRTTLLDQIALEEQFVKIGTGDKTALYALQLALRQSDEAIARSREIAREHPLGLEPCATSSMTLLAHCVGVQEEAKPPLAACEEEDVQQYLRLAR